MSSAFACREQVAGGPETEPTNRQPINPEDLHPIGPNLETAQHSVSLAALGHALNTESTRTVQHEHVQEHPVSLAFRASRFGQVAKRSIDFCSAAVLFLLLLPALIACAVWVKLNSRGSVFFKHVRVGRGGKLFYVWKFRTMCHDSERILREYLDRSPEARREWQSTQKLADDPRITRGGRLMRRFSLDELPQLWNILKGDMSLVGPRPIVTSEIGRYGAAIYSYYAVRPGLTGLWQVSGRSNTTYKQRVDLDRQYVERWSPLLDTSICLKTVRVLLTREGAY
jgi:lipopolysaccharide/colanic/teichoic acid biosynthesis glycosyltransferase